MLLRCDADTDDYQLGGQCGQLILPLQRCLSGSPSVLWERDLCGRRDDFDTGTNRDRHFSRLGRSQTTRQHPREETPASDQFKNCRRGEFGCKVLGVRSLIA